jgi:hypothetical protein
LWCDLRFRFSITILYLKKRNCSASLWKQTFSLWNLRILFLSHTSELKRLVIFPCKNIKYAINDWENQFNSILCNLLVKYLFYQRSIIWLIITMYLIWNEMYIHSRIIYNRKKIGNSMILVFSRFSGVPM